MISPANVSIENFPLLKYDSINIFCFDPCGRFVTVQIFQEVPLLLISIDIQTFTSLPLLVRFPQSRYQSKTQDLLNEYSIKKSLLSSLASESENSREILLILLFLYIQTDVLPKVVFFFSIRVGIENFLNVENF